MPGEDELLRLIDLPKNQQDIEAMMQALIPLREAIKELSGNSIGSKNAAGIADYKRNSAEITQGLQQMAEMQKKLLDLENQVASAKKNNSKTAKDQTDEQLRASIKLQQDLKTRKDAIKAEEDAYKQLALAYNKAAAEAKKLQAEALKGGDKGAADAATAKAKALSDQLKGIDHPVGDDRRNVGNYLEAIRSLAPELQSVKAQLDAMRASGQQNTQEFHKLQEQFAALNTITSRQAEGFASVTQQLRFMERALQTMREAGLKNTAAFKEMQIETANARREFNEFANQEKVLASGAPILTSLTVAAKGLAGVYAIGAGATALLADGNEKVEKELNKLVAVMTVLQGLQEAHELLMKRGAIAVAFSAAAEKIRNFILTGSATALRGKSAAEVVNTEVELANTEATELNTVATEAQTVAQDAMKIATEESTAAMVALRVALIASGIAALLLLLPLAASAFGLFAKNAKEAAKEALELEEMLDKLSETIARQAELELQYLNDQREGLQEHLSSLEKEGKNYYEIFAIRKRLAEVDQQEAEHLLLRSSKQNDIRTAVRKTTDEIDGQTSALHAHEAVYETLQKIASDGFKHRSESQRKAAQEDLDNEKKSIDLERKRLEDKKKLLDDYNAKVAAAEDLELELEKFRADEQRALGVAIVKARAEGLIAANARIVADERSTQAQILAAMDAGLRQQLVIIEAERKAKRADPSLTPAGREQVNVESGAAARAAVDANNEAKRKKNEEFFKRYLAAVNEVNKAALDAESKTAEAASNNVKLSLDKRLASYEEYATKQAALINADAGFQKQVAGLTSEELFAIEVKRQQRLQELYVSGQAKQAAIITSSLEAQNKKLQGSAQLAGLKEEVKGLEELAQKFKEGKITIEAYQQARQALADKSSRDSLAIQTGTLEFIRGEYARYGLDVQDIDKQIYENKKHLAELDLSNEEKIQERKKELRSKEVELAQKTESAIAAFIDGGFERQLNGIQKQIDLNNKSKETETRNIQQSTLSAQQKAATLIELDATTAAHNEELQRKQRDIKVKEAEFDKAKAILDIGVAEGTAVAKTLLTASVLAADPLTAIFAPEAYTLAAIEGGIAAAEIAAVAAKPIPKYWIGTDNHPGGPMYTHAGELRVDPDGTITPTPNKETLSYGDPGTKIIPAHEVRAMMMADILSSAGGSPASSSQVEEKLDQLNSTFKKGNQDLVNAIRKQRPGGTTIKIDGAFMAYITETCKN